MVLETPTEPRESSNTAVAEERVILNNISWETFERLLAEAGDHRSTRFYYLEGRLELMSPLARHEGSNRFIESLISAIAEELGLNLRKLGSLTMKRPDRQAGGEPDSCYYIPRFGT
jgi:Uma2 family endonuclease